MEQANKFHTDGRLNDAVAKVAEVLSLERSLFGNEHEKVVDSLQQLATWQEEAGNSPDAMKALQKILEINEKKFGNDHWQVADARRALSDLDLRSKLTPEQRHRLAEAIDANNRLVQLYQQGHFAEALPLAMTALQIRKEILGENHLDTAASLSWIATVYMALDDYTRAAPLFEQVVAINKQILGEKHPLTAQCRNNLAGLYEAKGMRVPSRQLACITQKTSARTFWDNARPIWFSDAPSTQRCLA